MKRFKRRELLEQDHRRGLVLRDRGSFGGTCRIGLEAGDAFACTYGCPDGFCPKTMGTLHTLCEAARAGGDYRLLGGLSGNEIEFVCADGAVTFRLRAVHTGG